MVSIHSQQNSQLAWPLRWLSLIAGLVLLAMLLIASRLTPATEGRGTHTQLGLPPCVSLVLWGKPCPACGMTTSWSYIMHGQLWQGANSNLGGCLLAVIALAFVPASCYFFLVGRTTKGQWFSMALAIVLSLSLGLATLQWIIRVCTGT